MQNLNMLLTISIKLIVLLFLISLIIILVLVIIGLTKECKKYLNNKNDDKSLAEKVAEKLKNENNK